MIGDAKVQVLREGALPPNAVVMPDSGPSKPDVPLGSDEIKSIVIEMQLNPASPEQRKSIYSAKYPYLVERYPSLFSMACQKGFDVEKFSYMMDMRDKIYTNERTVDDASKEVGQKFYNMYMKK